MINPALDLLPVVFTDKAALISVVLLDARMQKDDAQVTAHQNSKFNKQKIVLPTWSQNVPRFPGFDGVGVRVRDGLSVEKGLRWSEDD